MPESRLLERSERRKTGEPLRGTQSFVRVMEWCWLHPSVVALEVLWRWIFGGVVLWLSATRVVPVVLGSLGGTKGLSRLGLDRLTLLDPSASAVRLTELGAQVLPGVRALAVWLGPLLLALWIVLSTLGRMAVLRRVDSTLRLRPFTLAGLQTIRLVALGAVLLLWLAFVRWAAIATVSAPMARGEDPALVAYFAMAILGTLCLFVLWALASWSFSLAPLLAVRLNIGVAQSLRRSLAGGPVRMKLIEINLVMGIVKIALLVLLMVFSACPLPFQSVTTPEFLFWWTVGVALLYFVASDFFHVARQVAYLEVWQVCQSEG